MEDKTPRPYWSRFWLYVVNAASLPIMILAAGLLIGWRVTAASQSTSSHVNGWWPFGFLVLFIIGAALYIIKIDKKIRKNPQGVDTPDVYEEVVDTKAMVVETHQMMTEMYRVTMGEPELEVAKNDEAPIMVGSSLTVPSGAIVSSAIGAGDLMATVPSGISGPGVPETFDIPILEGQTVTFVLGGTVRAAAAVTGHLTAEVIEPE